MSASHESHHPLTLSGELRLETGVIINKCYQCGKCSAGCPVAEEMDYPPSLVMRMLQTDDPKHYEKLLRSMSIWLCVSCEMCLTRCPMEIDIPTLMDNLRQRSYKAKKTNPQARLWGKPSACNRCDCTFNWLRNVNFGSTLNPLILGLR